MKRICAYMMAALLALSSVFCPAMPVLAEGEEIIDASGYGTMVEDVLTDRFHGMEPNQQIFVNSVADSDVVDKLLDTLDADEQIAYFGTVLDQKDYGTGKTVTVTNVADLKVFDQNSEPTVKNAKIQRTKSTQSQVMTTSTNNASVDGLVLDKKVVYDNESNSYMVQLEAYTTGTVTTTTKFVPADIILILDLSGSMISNYMSDGQRRLDALRTAAEKFVEQVYEQAQKGVNHKIAIVRFGNGIQYKRLFDNDELGVLKDEYYYWPTKVVNNKTVRTGEKIVSTGIYNGSSFTVYPAADAVSGALKQMNGSTGTTNKNNMVKAIRSLNTMSSCATLSELGFELANNILANNGVNNNRNRVVVMFSDGGPGWNSRWFDVNRAYQTINYANTAKDLYKASVYTVGVFTGANSIDAEASLKPPIDSVKPNATKYTLNTSNNTYSADYKNDILPLDATLGPAGAYTKYCNWFLHSVSSNNGTIQKPSYYLSTEDTGSLNTIFETIANTISKPTVSMETETVIRDYMSSYFELPAGTDASKVVIKTAPYSAEGTFGSEINDDCGATAKIEADGSVSVTGFDFNHYFCTPTKKNTGDMSYGRKLIIRFPIEPVAGFLGGNNVPTNDSAKSGIYASGTETTPIATFPAPSANVPLVLPDFTVADKTVYYGTQVKPDELDVPFAVPQGSTIADYVNIVYTTPEEDISKVTCTENLQYTLQITAKEEAAETSVGPAQPTTVTNAAKQQRTKQANVHVLVPEKTYKDTSIYLGQTADYTNNGADTAHTWIDQSGHTGYPTVTGTAPEVVFTYNPAEGAFETDTAVNVTATIGGAEATNAVSFKWTDCTANHGSWPKIETPHLGSVDTPEFYVHILNNSLTIIKTGLNQFVYTDGSDRESAIFTVKEEGGKNRTWTVPINGDGSVTLDGLYVGVKYIVQELNDWTWRYNNNDAHFKLLDPGTNNVFIFENVLRDDKAWLNGDNYENNVFSN